MIDKQTTRQVSAQRIRTQTGVVADTLKDAEAIQEEPALQRGPELFRGEGDSAG